MQDTATTRSIRTYGDVSIICGSDARQRQDQIRGLAAEIGQLPRLVYEAFIQAGVTEARASTRMEVANRAIGQLTLALADVVRISGSMEDTLVEFYNEIDRLQQRADSTAFRIN